MKQVKAVVDRVVGGVLVFLMGVAVVNVLWQIFTRFVLGAPSSFTEELARYLLIWIGVLGAGYALGQRAHLALELLPDYLTGRSRKRLELGIQACMGLFAFFVLLGGGAGLVYVQFYLGQTSPSLGWPLGAVYMVLPLSGLLMTFYVVERMTEQVAQLRAGPGERASGAARSRDGHGPTSPTAATEKRSKAEPNEGAPASRAAAQSTD